MENGYLMLNKNKIVVTGGTGRFGKVLKNYDSKKKYLFPTKKELNILKINSIKKYLKKTKPKYLIHLAGLSRPMSIHDDDIERSINLNIVGTSNIVSACSLLKMKLHTNKSKDVLQKLLNSKDEKNITAALEFLDEPIGIMNDDKLMNFLNHNSHKVREESLRIASKRKNPELLNHIIGNLAHPKSAMQARLALGGFEEELVLHKLDKILFVEDSEFPNRMGIIRCLKQYKIENSLNILQKGLDETYLNILREVTNSLISVARGYPPSEDFIHKIEISLENIAQNVYQLVLFLDSLPDD